MAYWPVSHRDPVYPAVHVHVKLTPSTSLQVAPFTQGSVKAHTSTATINKGNVLNH